MEQAAVCMASPVVSLTCAFSTSLSG